MVPVVVQAVIASALRAEHQARVSSPALDRARSIRHAPRPVDLQEPVAQAHPEHVRDLAHGQVLDHRAPVVLVDRVPALAAHRRLEKRLVRSVITRLRAVADASSIRRPRKVR